MSQRRLGAALRKAYPDLRGTSDSGVRHYVDGDVLNPRVELLRAMADVLRVRADWLAYGEGPMTEEEALRQAEAALLEREVPSELVQEADPDAPPHPRLQYKQMIKGAILELSGEAPATIEDIPFWAEGLIEVTKRAMRSDVPLPVPDDEAIADVAKAVRGPIEALGVDFEEMQERGLNVLADYITALVPALLLLVAERERQRSVLAKMMRRMEGESQQKGTSSRRVG